MWDCFLACASDFTSTLIHHFVASGISVNKTNIDLSPKTQFLELEGNNFIYTSVKNTRSVFVGFQDGV